mmetsp:Transcript_3784/g.5713  ORF Transcript_3784/g.5713 Transcript_3784/m.5713 type:complete len:110 (-) Transcript_3784:586-915(-)|eukprot:CAMPEP_0170511328 /NCGR_PEP_ID=MMETSP0208-20121228/66248_1 /TAXON_ID=197538 /ORGANISM="Strombidium inclinatum, Strain S3" /LENGTH=109 /DNA_ID=CAMNT_0010794863 /DNA_START=57 /DNA_END=386 /DNA_ORIENTATION=+
MSNNLELCLNTLKDINLDLSNLKYPSVPKAEEIKDSEKIPPPSAKVNNFVSSGGGSVNNPEEKTVKFPELDHDYGLETIPSTKMESHEPPAIESHANLKPLNQDEILNL